MLHTHIMMTATLLITAIVPKWMERFSACATQFGMTVVANACAWRDADAAAKSLSERCDSLNSLIYRWPSSVSPRWTNHFFHRWYSCMNGSRNNRMARRDLPFTHSWYLESQVPRLSSPSVRVVTMGSDKRLNDRIFDEEMMCSPG